jgi:hypothetical protein
VNGFFIWIGWAQAAKTVRHAITVDALEGVCSNTMIELSVEKNGFRRRWADSLWLWFEIWQKSL